MTDICESMDVLTLRATHTRDVSPLVNCNEERYMFISTRLLARSLAHSTHLN